MAEIILGIGLLIFLAHVFTALFERRKIPDVLLLILLGLILGPGLHLVAPEDFGKVGRVISTIALVVILFESGVTLNPGVIARNARCIVSLTLATFVVTVAICATVAHYVAGMPWINGVILGCVLGGVSAAVAIALVKSLRIKDPAGTVLVMESAFGDVLSIVLMLGMVESSLVGHFSPAKLFGEILSSVVLASLFGTLGGVAWIYVLNHVRRFPNTAFTTLAFAFVVYGFTEIFEFSGAIAAMAFGAVISNHHLLRLDRISFLTGREIGQLSQSDMDFYSEILFLLKTFFFVYLGMSIHFADRNVIVAGVIIVALLYLIRPLLVRLTMNGKGVGVDEASIASIMVPKGLVSAVLASIPVERGVLGAEMIQSMSYMVVLFSILTTAVLIPLTRIGVIGYLYGRLFYGWTQVEAVEGEVVRHGH